MGTYNLPKHERPAGQVQKCGHDMAKYDPSYRCCNGCIREGKVFLPWPLSMDSYVVGKDPFPTKVRKISNHEDRKVDCVLYLVLAGIALVPPAIAWCATCWVGALVTVGVMFVILCMWVDSDGGNGQAGLLHSSPLERPERKTECKLVSHFVRLLSSLWNRPFRPRLRMPKLTWPSQLLPGTNHSRNACLYPSYHDSAGLHLSSGRLPSVAVG